MPRCRDPVRELMPNRRQAVVLRAQDGFAERCRMREVGIQVGIQVGIHADAPPIPILPVVLEWVTLHAVWNPAHSRWEERVGVGDGHLARVVARVIACVIACVLTSTSDAHWAILVGGPAASALVSTIV